MIKSAPEEWRGVLGYEGLYEASSLGRVRRIAPQRYAGIRKVYVTRDGYHMISLSKDGQRHRFQVGEIVCLAFHGNRPTPKHQCAHWNGDSSHNEPGNLRWATPKENCADRQRHGRTYRGRDHVSSKLTEADVGNIRMRYQPGLGQKLAEEFNISRRQVSHIVRRLSWAHLDKKEEHHA